MRALALLLALALGACDGAFEPDLEGAPPVAVFGTLDGRGPRQSLRVHVLGESLLEPPEALPATVTSTELGSGQTTAWRDSLITLATGERAHLFVADLAVRPGETHRVEAVRDADGGTATVEVRIPNPTATTQSPVPENVTIRVDVADLPGRVTEPVFRYRVRRADGTRDTTFAAPAPPLPGSSTFLAFLVEAKRRASLALGDAAPPILVEARLEAVVFSIVGAPVENGVGEVGWVTPVSVPVPFTPEALTAAGFVDGR